MLTQHQLKILDEIAEYADRYHRMAEFTQKMIRNIMNDFSKDEPPEFKRDMVLIKAGYWQIGMSGLYKPDLVGKMYEAMKELSTTFEEEES